jgi:hypothetical protein
MPTKPKKRVVTRKSVSPIHRLLVATKLKKPAGRASGASAGFIAIPKSRLGRIKAGSVILVFAAIATYFTIFSSAAVVTLARIEAEKMSIPSSANKNSNWVTLWSNSTASGSFTNTGVADTITIRAKGDQCAGAPQMVVRVDGQQLPNITVSASAFTDYASPISLAAGNHSLQLSFTNDYWLPSNCDRNLYIDRTTVYGTTAPVPTVSLNANPTTINSGSTSTLSWSSTNATSCTASGGWTGTKATSGSQATAALTTNTTYNLSCSGTGGSASASATVSVTAPPAGTMIFNGSHKNKTMGPVSSLLVAPTTVIGTQSYWDNIQEKERTPRPGQIINDPTGFYPAGTRVFKAEVTNTDYGPAGGNPRTELMFKSVNDNVPGQEYWYSYAMWIPPDLPMPPDGSHFWNLTQWYGATDQTSYTAFTDLHVFGIWNMNGTSKLYLRNGIEENKDLGGVMPPRPVDNWGQWGLPIAAERGKWLEFIVCWRWSNPKGAANGREAIWWRRPQTESTFTQGYDNNAVQTFPAGLGRYYLKQGMYHSANMPGQTGNDGNSNFYVLHTGLKYGTTRAVVDPTMGGQMP